MEDNIASQKELNELFRVRGENALRIFEETIFSGIENPQLLAILEDVQEIWKDRFRPTLTCLSCEAVGGNFEDTHVVNLMVGLAGAGIGIHDDIVDKSRIKHFRKTILGLHGIEGTLLAGDLLLVKGLTAVQEIMKRGHSPQKVAEILNVLQRHYIDICEGVFMERQWKKNLEIELDFCHQVLLKYGSDGEACTKLGAIMGNGTKREVEALGGYGRLLCYIFRLAEEVKDTLHLEGDLLRRLKFESIPIPLLYAAQTSEKNTYLLKSILEGPITSSDLKTLLELCFKTKAIEYVRDIAKKKVRKGIKILDTLKPSKARNFLTLIIQNIFPDFII
jgi:geranylgeranyl diphosphate synthase type I